MSEKVDQQPVATESSTSVDQGRAGAMLRQAREQAGLHVAALAATLKVPPHKLEALEAGRMEELLDRTFARALASSVCRVLKIDAGPVLAALPGIGESSLKAGDQGINEPFPLRASPMRSSGASSDSGYTPSRPAVIALLLLGLAVVLWFVLPGTSFGPATQSTVQADDAAQATTSVEATDAPMAATATGSALPGAVNPMPPAVSAVALSVQEPPVNAASQDAVSATAPQAAAPVAPPAAPPIAPVEALRLRAKQASWVQVTGASGRVLLQRSLQAGEEVSLSADLPLSVIVGRADQIEVVVHGSAMDLATLARNNVARFEVK